MTQKDAFLRRLNPFSPNFPHIFFPSKKFHPTPHPRVQPTRQEEGKMPPHTPLHPLRRLGGIEQCVAPRPSSHWLRQLDAAQQLQLACHRRRHALARCVNIPTPLPPRARTSTAGAPRALESRPRACWRGTARRRTTGPAAAGPADRQPASQAISDASRPRGALRSRPVPPQAAPSIRPI